MRLRIWHRLFAVAAGAIVLAGPATAQTQNSPQPIIIPQAPPAVAPRVAPNLVAQPAPSPTTPAVPNIVVTQPTAPSTPGAAAAQPLPPGPGAIVIPGNGGCSNYATEAVRTPGKVHQHLAWANGGYFCNGCQYGTLCNSGCGSFRSDLGFAFGSCRSFFAPCGPYSCPKFWGGRHGKDLMYGPGTNGPFNPCHYDSYLNH